MAFEVARLNVVVGANTTEAEKGLKQMDEQVQGFAGRVRSSTDIIGKSIAGIGVAIGTAVGKSVQMAAGFEQQMRNVNAIAQLGPEAFEKLTDQVLQFSLTTRASSEEVANALYQVASAGMELDETLGTVTFEGKEMSEAMAVMSASSRAAGAGLASTEDVARLLIATMSNYNYTAQDLTYINNLFLQTVNEGLTTLPQLAHSMGMILPTAKNVGVSLEELNFVLARMTQTGLSTEHAVTRLNSLMVSMMKPSTALEEALSDLGYTSGIDLIESVGGLTAALRVLKENGFIDTKDAVADLFPNFRAIGGSLALLNDTLALSETGWKDFAAAAQEGGGAVERARQQQYASFSTAVLKLKGAFEVLSIEIGMQVLPHLTDLVTLIRDFVVAAAPKIISAVEGINEAFSTLSVYTRRVITFVADKVTLWYVSLEHLIRHLMGSCYS